MEITKLKIGELLLLTTMNFLTFTLLVAELAIKRKKTILDQSDFRDERLNARRAIRRWEYIKIYGLSLALGLVFVGDTFILVGIFSK